MKVRYHYIFFFLFTINCVSQAGAQKAPAFLGYLDHAWVDSVLHSMNIQQKIGQLFMVQAYSKEATTSAELLNQIKKFQVGGVLFMQGTAVNQATITNNLQKNSKIPLLIAIDAEWGPGFRLNDTPKYPVQMALGAIKDDSLIYRMGYEIGLQLKRLGVHINFAPVADVNNNPDNPVINYRSFGEDPEKVAWKAYLYATGMQDAGILAVAKHFPGHGDTKIDSHMGLPVIGHERERLNLTELYPFKQLAYNGIGGIMTAHLQVPALEPDPLIPSSLSSNIIKKLLVEELGFRGLIITDAMNMQGVNKQFGSGEAAVRALQAGNDMLEVVPDLAVAVNAVIKAVNDGRLAESEIDAKCRKILALKKWIQSGGNSNPGNNANVSLAGLTDFLNNPNFNLTKRLLHEQSLTLLRNKNQLLPLQNLDTLRIAVIAIGSNKHTAFQRMTANYMKLDFFSLNKNASPQEIDRLVKLLSSYNLLICGIHNLNLTPTKNYGTDRSISDFLKKTSDKKKIVALFGNPYALNFMSGIELAEALLVTYQDNTITQELAAQAIFGALDIIGKLPVNVNPFFKLNDGIDIKKNDRLKYTIPEEVGISSQWLEQHIDSLAKLGIRSKAYPGCQVLIARYGKVILNKCYGFHTYENTLPVKKDDVYDLASITKIIGPVPVLMKLYGEGKFNLDVPFSDYWTDFKKTDKARITSRQVLAHQARLKAGIAFWMESMRPNGNMDTLIFCNHFTPTHEIQVSSNMYMNKDNIAKMFKMIRDSKLLARAKYTYSDLAFYLFPTIIENITGNNYETWLKQNFYLPLGASTITYNPRYYFPQRGIIPTENDTYFRKELLLGFVHDEGASMLGGVSGNAGLFSNANDLAKMMQMYLQNGWYGGRQFIASSSIAEFTRIQYPEFDNRRGLGFDKPRINNYLYRPENTYPTTDASPESYGHSGYTGTFTWADPVTEILFVFMSNRVYPTRNNSKLSTLNIRPAMLQTIYDSIKIGIANY